jgi:hypothetical protein
MKLQEKLDSNIKNASNMFDGEVGIIINSAMSKYNGRIVQKYGDALVCLQSSYGDSWVKAPETLKVRILQKGEVLIIE